MIPLGTPARCRAIQAVHATRLPCTCVAGQVCAACHAWHKAQRPGRQARAEGPPRPPTRAAVRKRCMRLRHRLDREAIAWAAQQAAKPQPVTDAWRHAADRHYQRASRLRRLVRALEAQLARKEAL